MENKDMPPKNPSQEIKNRFEEDFGFTEKEFQASELNKLPLPEQKVILNYMGQDLATTLETVGLKKFQEETAIKGKGWKKAKSILSPKRMAKTILRSYYTPTYRREIAKEMTTKGLEGHKNRLGEIAQQVSELATQAEKSNLKFEVGENGITSKYFSGIEGANFSKEEEKGIAKFNEVAKKYATQPSEWDKKNKNKFNEKSKEEREYGEALEVITGILKKKRRRKQ